MPWRRTWATLERNLGQKTQCQCDPPRFKYSRGCRRVLPRGGTAKLNDQLAHPSSISGSTRLKHCGSAAQRSCRASVPRELRPRPSISGGSMRSSSKSNAIEFKLQSLAIRESALKKKTLTQRAQRTRRFAEGPSGPTPARSGGGCGGKAYPAPRPRAAPRASAPAARSNRPA